MYRPPSGDVPLGERRVLPPAIDADWSMLDGAAGGVCLYADLDAAGQGTPTLLVHSVNAAASAWEMRPLFERWRGRRPVAALDLPGFGLSERSDRRYTPALMTDAVLQAADALSARTGGGPIDVVALSLSCEFAARAIGRAPGRFRSLSMISPTGLSGRTLRRGPEGATREVPGLLRALRWPVWSERVYRGLTRPGTIRYFLRRTWGSRDIDESLLAYDVATARQPGARFAPLHFLSGTLFSADVGTLYDRLSLPTWVVHGIRGDFTDYRLKREFERRAHWRFDVLPTGALPQFEMLDTLDARREAALAALLPA